VTQAGELNSRCHWPTSLGFVFIALGNQAIAALRTLSYLIWHIQPATATIRRKANPQRRLILHLSRVLAAAPFATNFRSDVVNMTVDCSAIPAASKVLFVHDFTA